MTTFICRCGADYLSPPDMPFSPAAIEWWRNTHTGNGHGPCSEFQRRARHGEMVLVGKDYCGDDWTRESDAAPGQQSSISF
jgi:hypothetical protein